MQPVVDSLWPYMSEPKQEQWLAQLEKVAQHKAGLTYGRGRNKRRLDSDGDVVPQSQTTAPNGTATIINNLEEVT
jgi:hypothetical protein